MATNPVWLFQGEGFGLFWEGVGKCGKCGKCGQVWQAWQVWFVCLLDPHLHSLNESSSIRSGWPLGFCNSLPSLVSQGIKGDAIPALPLVSLPQSVDYLLGIEYYRLRCIRERGFHE